MSNKKQAAVNAAQTKLSMKVKFHRSLENSRRMNDKRALASSGVKLLTTIFRLILIIGISYVIISPVLGMLVNSFFSNADKYNPMVYMIPTEPTLERYRIAIERMDYFAVAGKTILYSVTLMILQVLICSMVGYGFARFDFPCKKLLFGCVVITIVIPTHTIMLPLYMTFRNFDIGGMIAAAKGTPGIMGTVWPMYIMTLFGCGLRSGLYIYIFNQFFRGLPKEIEEAAFVDGAGMWYTYFKIMLVNAIPAVTTVSVFSLVWQYNDTFFAQLFNISSETLLSRQIATLQSTVANVDKILDTGIQELFVDAGVVLVMLPVIIIYICLQRQFIEGVERSGIVG